MSDNDIFKLIEAIKNLGWEVAISSSGGNKDENLIGMIIGKKEYVERVLNGDHLKEENELEHQLWLNKNYEEEND